MIYREKLVWFVVLAPEELDGEQTLHREDGGGRRELSSGGPRRPQGSSMLSPFFLGTGTSTRVLWLRLKLPGSPGPGAAPGTAPPHSWALLAPSEQVGSCSHHLGWPLGPVGASGSLISGWALNEQCPGQVLRTSDPVGQRFLREVFGAGRCRE